MEYVNDINIMEAVIHVLDNNGEEPILNEYKIELTDDVYRFLYRHLDRAFRDEELKYAVFNPEEHIIKAATQEYLNGETRDFIKVSKEIAKHMFLIMKGNSNIPSCDLICVVLSTDQGPMIGILKMDYVSNFTHKVDFYENGIGIGIVEHLVGLPASAKKIQKCAFIKPIRCNNNIDLMVIDKQRKTKDDEYGANYFTNNFLGCVLITNERDMTKSFVNSSEKWIRNYIFEDADKAEAVRTTIKSKLRSEESINIELLSQELFVGEPEKQKGFVDYVMSDGIENEITVDKKFVDKKLKRVRLKVDRDIDLYIDGDAYHDPSKFEIVRNGDGSINMVIKHVKNYIEK